MHLRQFGDLPHSEALLVGIGENAGVVDVGDGYAVTFKVESHNHPSYVEPYQGAATGVGGIVRDILTMGARPIAVMDSPPLRPRRRPRHRPRAARRRRRRRRLRQLPGPAQHRRRAALRRLLRREPAGQRAVRRRHAARGRAAGQGRGRRQQGDPVRRPHRRRRHRRRQRAGVSETFDEHGPAKRPSVQVGDPFTEKLLIEACLEIFAADLVTGIQDLGGAGLSCATSELASAGTGGMHVDLDTVPLRDSTLTPAEILMSESQERMCAIVEPAKVEAVPRRLPQVGRARHRHR